MEVSGQDDPSESERELGGEDLPMFPFKAEDLANDKIYANNLEYTF